MKNERTSKKPVIYYVILALSILLLLNVFVFPWIMRVRITQVDYGAFLQMLDSNKIVSVEMNKEETQINFVTNEDGKNKRYSTGAFPDLKLVERLSAHPEIKYDKLVPIQNSLLLSFLLTWLLPTVILFAGGVLMVRLLNKRTGGNNAMTFGKSNAKMYVAAQTGKTFADVAGQEEAKEALEEIVDFLHNPDKYRSVGAVMPKGVLLVGPPGTGKTLLAQAVAGEAEVPFFSIAGSEFVEMFVGQGAARVRDLFRQAKEKSPCIVFIDEIDTIGKKRDGTGFGGNDEREQTLNQLLSEMDGFDASSGVVLLAATNRPDSLDRALLRPGRFDRRVPVELPDLAGREAIMRVHAKRISLDKNIDFLMLARATSGASGAQIANIVNEAALRCVKCNRTNVTQADLEDAIDVVVAGHQRKNAVLTQSEKLTVAYHEIGHAIVAVKLPNLAPVTKITIVPRTSGALGYTMQTPDTDAVLLSRDEAMARLAVLTAGRSAEELMQGSISSGAANDIKEATCLARNMVMNLGMSEQFDMMALETQSNRYLGADRELACSEATGAKVDDEVLMLIKKAHNTAKEILTENKAMLQRLADYLLEKETITGEEMQSIMSGDM
ncbi:MAG: ATP-dependent zinc metalloprotease FtsH [Oscillospiraceae bacterium]